MRCVVGELCEQGFALGELVASNGNGVGGTLQIVTTSTGSIASVSVSGGTGYSSSDTITINDSLINGAATATNNNADLTITPLNSAGGAPDVNTVPVIQATIEGPGVFQETNSPLFKSKSDMNCQE